jgi:hypothetical protein
VPLRHVSGFVSRITRNGLTALRASRGTRSIAPNSNCIGNAKARPYECWRNLTESEAAVWADRRHCDARVEIVREFHDFRERCQKTFAKAVGAALFDADVLENTGAEHDAGKYASANDSFAPSATARRSRLKPLALLPPAQR